MATNKNQHFVPRCYLKPFTLNGEGKCINVYNLDRGVIIPNAPVKNQCSRDYFYGEDLVLENALKDMEGLYATALAEIVGKGYVISEGHKELLLTFWLIQYSRTESASRRLLEIENDLHESIGLDDARMSIKEAVQQSMRVGLRHARALLDLKVCLVRNSTQVQFVASDDPAMLTNQWFLSDRNARRFSMSFGLSNAGSLHFLPLSPDICFMAYDADVYSVPHNSGWVEASKESDVLALNQLQWLNSRYNVYYRMGSTADLKAQHVNAASRRPAARHKLRFFDKESDERGMERFKATPRPVVRPGSSSLVTTSNVHPVPQHWPSFVRRRTNGIVYTNGSAGGYVRRGNALAKGGPKAGYRATTPWQ